MTKMVGRKSRRFYFTLVGAFVMVMVFSFLVLKFKNSDEANAADLSRFNAGYIISDFQMSDYRSMSEAEIQNFLSAKNPCSNTNYGYYLQLSGNPNYTWHFENGHFICLSQERFGNNDNEIGFQYGETAAHIIWQAAQDYRINPKVILVLLQKETGLITDPIPNNGDYRKATGYGCPDTAACSSQYYGFKNQVRNAVALFRTVLDGGWTNYPVGNNYVQYNPNAACGGSIINIQNRATSALYRYTPYQPNAGALAAGYGTAPCGAYGNRNFYQYFEDWFGNITGEAKYEAFVYPRYLKLTEDTERVHTYSGNYYDTMKAGTIVKYTSKINIRGKVYYRTEWATNNSVDIVVPAAALAEVPEKYEKMEPVYLELVDDTERVNPYTGGYVDTLKAGTIYCITSKIEINGKVYYRTEWATNNNADMAVPMTTLADVTMKYQSFQTPRYMRLRENTKRVNPYTNNYIDTLEAGAIIYFTSKIDINGKTYYRTKWATDNNMDMAIPAEAAEEVSSYAAFVRPRNMKLKKAVRRVNPYTGEYVDTLEAGMVIYFTSKIDINGKTYYRTKWATDNNMDMAIPAEAAEEVEKS